MDDIDGAYSDVYKRQVVALGYSEKEAESALKKVNRQESVENIIKECLRVLMG